MFILHLFVKGLTKDILQSEFKNFLPFSNVLHHLMFLSRCEERLRMTLSNMTHSVFFIKKKKRHLIPLQFQAVHFSPFLTPVLNTVLNSYFKVYFICSQQKTSLEFSSDVLKDTEVQELGQASSLAQDGSLTAAEDFFQETSCE